MRYFRLICLLLVVFCSGHSFTLGEIKEETIVVSVFDINNPGKHRKSVTIQLLVHHPVELMGSSFILVTDSKERAKVRSELPLGSLHVLSLSNEMINKLKAELDEMEKDQRSIDKGIEPGMISNLIILPEVRMADLSGAITNYSLKR